MWASSDPRSSHRGTSAKVGRPAGTGIAFARITYSPCMVSTASSAHDRCERRGCHGVCNGIVRAGDGVHYVRSILRVVRGDVRRTGFAGYVLPSHRRGSQVLGGWRCVSLVDEPGLRRGWPQRTGVGMSHAFHCRSEPPPTVPESLPCMMTPGAMRLALPCILSLTTTNEGVVFMPLPRSIPGGLRSSLDCAEGEPGDELVEEEVVDDCDWQRDNRCRRHQGLPEVGVTTN